MDNNVQKKVAWQNRTWLLALLLLVITFVAYLPLWHIDYIKGEGIDNDLHSLSGLHHIWTQQGEETPDILRPWLSKAYYPLTYTTYWLEYRFWGEKPLGYFLDNVLLHGLNAIVLWLILRRLSVPGAWLGAALWALHPVNVESVAWIAERKNTLSGLLYLCSILAALKYWLPEVQEGVNPGFTDAASGESRRGTIHFYWVALVLYVVSLLAKTTTIPLPVVILLLVWWKRGRIVWPDVRPLIIFPVMGIAMGLDTVHVEHNLSAADNFKTEFSLTLVDRFLIAGRDIWFYVGKLLWPHPLIFKYPLWKINPASVVGWLQVLAVPVLLCVLWFKRQNWGRPVLVVLLYFLILLAPVLSFVNAMFLRRAFVADHYLYLACMAPLALAAAGIVLLFDRFFGKAGCVLRSILCAGLLSILGVLTWNQCATYTDLETFYQTTLRLNPDAWQIRNDLAVLLSQRGQLEAAIQQYQMLLQIHPDPEIYHNLGIAYFHTQRPGEAAECFEKSVEMRPDYAIGYSDLGNLYLQSGQVDAAMAYLQKALGLQPNMPTTWYNLGNAYIQKRQLDLAIQAWQKAVTLQPDYAAAHNNLGNAFSIKGDMAEAIGHWRSALATEPDLESAQVNLAWILATCPQDSLRNGAEATQLAERADQLTGGRNPLVLRTLAAAYAEVGRFSDAVATAQQALQIATLRGNQPLAADVQGQLKFYQNNQPYRDTTKRLMDDNVHRKLVWQSRNWLLALLLLAVTFIAYQPVWHIGYIRGEGIDKDQQSWRGLIHIWTGLGQLTPENQHVGPGKAYYPLTYTTYWLEYHLWGPKPLGYYLVNVLLHGLNAIVLWLILRRLSVPGAWLGAALWALHPVNVESVAWIVERKNTLSGLFYLCSIMAASKYWLPETWEGQRSENAAQVGGENLRGAGTSANGKGQRGPIGFYWLTLGLYVLSLLAKTTTIPLPVVILLLVWWKRSRILWQDVRPLLIFPVLGMAMGLVTMQVEHNLSKWTGSGNFEKEFALPLVDRFLIAGRDIWFYLGKLLWPHPLILNYTRWAMNPSSALAWLQLLAVPMLLLILWLKRKSWGLPVLVAFLYFLFLLAPVLSFLNAMFFWRSFVADHYQYLACMGPLSLTAAAIVIFCDKLGRLGDVLKPLLCAALLSTLGLLTWNQCRLYDNLETLYQTTLSYNPGAWLMRDELAVIYLNEGQFEAGIKQLQMALQTHADAKISSTLADALLHEGRVEEATEYFRKALQIQPDFAPPYAALGNISLHQGHLDMAIEYFQKALNLDPTAAMPWYMLGNAYAQKGQLDLAIQCWQKAVEIKPDLGAAHSNLGNALSLEGHTAEAIQHWQSALATEPNLESALANLAWVLATCPQDSLRNGVEAEQLAEHADELTGGRDPQVLRVLAAACAENGDFPDAIEAAEHAIQNASLQRNKPLTADIQAQLKFYQNHQPFRDTRAPGY